MQDLGLEGTEFHQTTALAASLLLEGVAVADSDSCGIKGRDNLNEDSMNVSCLFIWEDANQHRQAKYKNRKSHSYAKPARNQFPQCRTMLQMVEM